MCFSGHNSESETTLANHSQPSQAKMDVANNTTLPDEANRAAISTMTSNDRLTASPSPFEIPFLDHRTDIEGPYTSPQVKLIIGQKDGQQIFYAHKDALCNYYYFRACLRSRRGDAFVEGQTNTIKLPEEDPFVFRRLLEWIYSEDCPPRWGSLKYEDLVPPPYIQRRVEGSIKEVYKGTSRQLGAVINGSSSSTDDTFALFQVVVLTMCAAERYTMFDLQYDCLSKIKKFPVGTKEVAILAQQVLKNIPPSRKEIYEQLQDFISSHRTRLLSDNQVQELFLQNEASKAAREFFKMVNLADTSRFVNWIKAALDGKLEAHPGATGLAICIKNVDVQELVNQYGPDDVGRYTTEFGSAKVGDIFITNGKTDKHGMIACWQGTNCLDDDGKVKVQKYGPAAYPASYFELLWGASFL